ncbi:MAG: succinate-semialdehyde dehydrogenase [Bacteroidetes bacterium GWF2_42_66]|nr:MAG: succinate-semialdehyde dehydrogenase [Bacteroidetes bacterium GWA2_42_15]OFX97929.1 MAG: succinate-semialdehyde dehydrogenase [Bacteroidetes bacterium GWE2_42_39]OFY45834.1 MAG: succinate-semialdehyde dehydrogenase [Bacteroidetes bacterium GWF2_42_66]HBL74665.1 succinate-semialdehyde dehydrogenase [Prolixibacteraceae bacterium]HCR89350.1 succinate-semialdehyde dehydrogenase [Prolixibacteraceae bacterium]
MQSINPYTGRLVASCKNYSEEKTNEIIDLVDAEFQQWKKAPFLKRKELMLRLKKQLLGQKETLASLMVAEMGKVKREALGEIEKCALVCDYYAENAESFLKNETIKTEASESYISFQPLGTVLAVMPWNFPFWQVFRFLAPALMAGNTGLLKHASNVAGCALAIEKLVTDAGFPENVFRTLLISGSEVKTVIENPKVKAVTLTGSMPAGKSVAAIAGSALKKSVLELGGSDPYIICEDADIAGAARLCVTSRLINAGQSCIGAKRFIVMETVYESFRNEFVFRMEAATYGDPNDPNTTIGPLARPDLRDELHQQVTKSVELGAKILCGGFIPEGKAPFYPPTVLENVKPGMPAYHEELFGPVAVLFCVKTMDEALQIANDTVFGLGASIFTSDIESGKMLAEKGLEAGCVFINDFVKSDPRLPFGGIKESGYGRELSLFGIREFVNIKTVVVR